MEIPHAIVHGDVETLRANIRPQDNSLLDAQISPMELALLTRNYECANTIINSLMNDDMKLPTARAFKILAMAGRYGFPQELKVPKMEDAENIMELALREKKVDVVRYLVCNGFDLKKKRSYSLLGLTAARDDVQMLEFLLENGCDINEQNVDGDTPLIMAAYAGHCEAFGFLLKRGARTDIQNKAGKVASYYFDRHNSRKHVKLAVMYALMKAPSAAEDRAHLEKKIEELKKRLDDLESLVNEMA